MPWEHLSLGVRWTVAGIWGFLLLATVVVRLIRRLKPEKDFSELAQRVRTWWVMVAVFSVALLLNRTVSLVFFAFISFLALKEYLSLIPTRRADRRVIFWAYLSIPFQYYWIGISWYGMFIIFIPVFIFLFLPLRMILIGDTSGFLHAVGTLHWGLMMTVFNMSHLAYLLVLAPAGNPTGGGAGLVLYLVLLTQLNDVAQYTWGKLFGRYPILPRVSPKKTYEGFLGGLVTTLALAILLAPLLTPFTLLEAFLAGLIISFGGFIGDVTISALKRDLGVKDSGSLLPGHGGVLDRVDSMTYTAPLFFHFVYYLHF